MNNLPRDSEMARSRTLKLLITSSTPNHGIMTDSINETPPKNSSQKYSAGTYCVKLGAILLLVGNQKRHEVAKIRLTLPTHQQLAMIQAASWHFYCLIINVIINNTLLIINGI